ncbi:MAG: prolipoprotein diacylglyceryl transferase [Parcubacteria group bacterium]
MINFLHTFHPQPVIFQIGIFPIHWYGFLMVIGGLLGLFVVLKLARRYGVDKNSIYDLLVYFVVGGVVGARVYYVVYAWQLYQNNWLDVFKIWQGGLAVHGVMIGGMAGVLIYYFFKKINFWLFADLAATGLAAAQIVGRVGNYFNQEIFGKPTNLPWGILIDAAARPTEFSGANYFHPTFLYESLGNVIILCVLIGLHFLKIRNKTLKDGNIFFLYIILYSILRFFLEFLRTDYSPLVFGVRWAQLFSALLIIAAAALLIARNRKRFLLN